MLSQIIQFLFSSCRLLENDSETTTPSLQLQSQPQHKPERRIIFTNYNYWNETTMKVIKTNYFDEKFVAKQIGKYVQYYQIFNSFHLVIEIVIISSFISIYSSHACTKKSKCYCIKRKNALSQSK